MPNIWKYPAAPSRGVQSHMMPGDARMLSIGVDPEHGVALWALVDPDADLVRVDYFVIGTGWPLPMEGEYVASCRVGMFVWHLFRVARPDVPS